MVNIRKTAEKIATEKIAQRTKELFENGFDVIISYYGCLIRLDMYQKALIDKKNKKLLKNYLYELDFSYRIYDLIEDRYPALLGGILENLSTTFFIQDKRLRALMESPENLFQDDEIHNHWLNISDDIINDLLNAINSLMKDIISCYQFKIETDDTLESSIKRPSLVFRAPCETMHKLLSRSLENEAIEENLVFDRAIAFISASFNNENDNLIDWFRKMAKSVDIETAWLKDIYETRPIRKKIEEHIKKCNVFIQIITKDVKEGSKEAGWIGNEIALATQSTPGNRIAIFVEKGVEPTGLAKDIADNLKFDRNDLSLAAPNVINYLSDLKKRAIIEV